MIFGINKEDEELFINMIKLYCSEKEQKKFTLKLISGKK